MKTTTVISRNTVRYLWVLLLFLQISFLGVFLYFVDMGRGPIANLTPPTVDSRRDACSIERENFTGVFGPQSRLLDYCSDLEKMLKVQSSTAKGTLEGFDNAIWMFVILVFISIALEATIIVAETVLRKER